MDTKSSELLNNIPNIGSKFIVIIVLKNKMIKILGLLYCPERDFFKYKIEIIKHNGLIATKRNTVKPLLRRNIGKAENNTICTKYVLKIKTWKS